MTHDHGEHFCAECQKGLDAFQDLAELAERLAQRYGPDAVALAALNLAGMWGQYMVETGGLPPAVYSQRVFEMLATATGQGKGDA